MSFDGIDIDSWGKDPEPEVRVSHAADVSATRQPRDRERKLSRKTDTRPKQLTIARLEAWVLELKHGHVALGNWLTRNSTRGRQKIDRASLTYIEELFHKLKEEGF